MAHDPGAMYQKASAHCADMNLKHKTPRGQKTCLLLVGMAWLA
jgi:hypothetical protein